MLYVVDGIVQLIVVIAMRTYPPPSHGFFSKWVLRGRGIYVHVCMYLCACIYVCIVLAGTHVMCGVRQCAGLVWVVVDDITTDDSVEAHSCVNNGS